MGLGSGGFGDADDDLEVRAKVAVDELAGQLRVFLVGDSPSREGGDYGVELVEWDVGKSLSFGVVLVPDANVSHDWPRFLAGPVVIGSTVGVTTSRARKASNCDAVK